MLRLILIPTNLSSGSGKIKLDQDALPHLEAKESGYGWVTIWDTRQKDTLPLPVALSRFTRKLWQDNSAGRDGDLCPR